MIQRLLHLLGMSIDERTTVKRSFAWPALSKHWLKMFPCCAVCGIKDKVVPHHVIPVHWPDGRQLELNWGNLLSLCPPHHLLFGHLGRWDSANPSVREDAECWRQKILARTYADDGDANVLAYRKEDDE